MDDYNLPRQLLICKKLRSRSNHKKKMSSVITKHGKIVAVGFNIQKTHPQYADGKSSYSLHAEVNTIIKSRTDLTGATIYVYREVAGIPAMACPCKRCMAIIIESGIKRVIYSISEYPYYKVVNL